MLNPYKPKDVSTCLESRRVVFAGDSITRQLFFNTAHLADPKLPSAPPSNDQKHADHTLTTAKQDITFEFLWDPFLNSSHTKELLEGRRKTSSEPPALVVLGSGLWYLRHSETSGGISAWEGMIDSTFSALERGGAAIGDKIVFLPVEEAISSKLAPDRAASILVADVDAMNSDLSHRVAASASTSWFDLSKPSTSVVSLPLAFNQMLTASQTEDGLHFSDKILATQANLLLNLRCNDALPKKMPFDKTCCRSYPMPSFLQGLVILCVLLLGTIAKFLGPRLGTWSVYMNDDAC